MTTPQLIKAGDNRLKLGYNSQPPRVDCRVVAEEYYQGMLKKIKQRDELLKILKELVDWVECAERDDQLESTGYSFDQAKKLIKTYDND